MTYQEAIQSLYALQMFGSNFGLENIQRLAALTGHPEQQLRFIHVAGTNGKGSTCAMLESIYRTAGFRVGLFTSPHLVSFAERIQVSRQLIPQSEVVRLVAETLSLIERGWGVPTAGAGSASSTEGPPPTFFEVVTLMALRYFAEQKCDLVVWETGLGGRLDATNIVTPLASVITNIDFDHQPWLGNSLREIATEKAGIIKPRIPVITSAVQPEALEVIAATAQKRDAQLTVIDWNDARGGLLDAVELPLSGEYQRLNAALSVATVRALHSHFPVSPETILTGLATVHWPGRMQIITTTAGQTLLLDGAHNIGSARALAETFREQFPDSRPTLILGILADKDWQSMAEILAPLAGRILLVPVNSARSLDPRELLPVCQGANPTATVAMASTLKEALALTAPDSMLVITGSLYLVGEAMELLRLTTVPAIDERGLNEWKAKAGHEAP